MTGSWGRLLCMISIRWWSKREKGRLHIHNSCSTHIVILKHSFDTRPSSNSADQPRINPVGEAPWRKNGGWRKGHIVVLEFQRIANPLEFQIKPILIIRKRVASCPPGLIIQRSQTPLTTFLVVNEEGRCQLTSATLSRMIEEGYLRSCGPSHVCSLCHPKFLRHQSCSLRNWNW